MIRDRLGACSLVVVAGVLAACSGASDEATSPSSVPAPVSTEGPFTTAEPASTTTTTTTTPGIPDGPLAEVCGDRLVVQTSDLPDVGAGPLYALLGAEPTVEEDGRAVTGQLTRADGTLEDVTLEIRSGGPAVGFNSAVSVMAEDDTIHLAQVSTAVAVRDRSTLATNAVVSLTDRSQDAIVVDPQTYPGVSDLPALEAEGVEIRHVSAAPVIAFLRASGVLAPEQLVDGSDGGPASFVSAQGAIAQQGELTIEPALLPALPQWNRAVIALPAFDAGWRSLDDLLVVDSETERVPPDCLGRFVRVVQESISAYVAQPAPANAVMSDVRSRINPLTRLTPELFDEGTRLAVDAGVFDSTRSAAPGSVDTDGLDAFLVELAAAMGVDAVSADELVDARFIDPEIAR